MREYFTPPLQFDENPYVRKAKEDEERRRKEEQEQARRKRQARHHDVMTRVKALTILGLKDGASPAEIKAAYGRLMGKVHPDKGGTNFFAQQLNEARDFLLAK